MIKTETTLFDVQGRCAWITLNRPESLNSLNLELRWQLSKHLDDIEADDSIWLTVITGAGERAFSAGADLKERARERDATEEQKAAWRKLQSDTRHIIERWYHPKPIIAMVNGYALGGGLEVAMACDIIVAADHAQFGLPEPRRGLIAGSAGVHRLPRTIGIKPAMGYMLTGRHMSAQRAYELGLVNDVVPADQLLETTQGYVDDILRCAPLAVRATKEASTRGLDRSLSEAFYTPYESERIRLQSEDSREGPRAFAEKREPRWQGK
jgi:enoyl-CoA hydratase/carnithine racemase